MDLTTLTKEKIEEVRKAMAIVESITGDTSEGLGEVVEHRHKRQKTVHLMDSIIKNLDSRCHSDPIRMRLPNLDETFVTDF